jgi:hypothetical protein
MDEEYGELMAKKCGKCGHTRYFHYSSDGHCSACFLFYKCDGFVDAGKKPLMTRPKWHGHVTFKYFITDNVRELGRTIKIFLGIAEKPMDTCHCGLESDHAYTDNHYGIPANCNCHYSPPRRCPVHPKMWRWYRKAGIAREGDT